MTRGQRLALWIVVCIACLSAPVWRLALGTDPVVLLAAGLQATLGLAAIYWLIVTTPFDAIRLGPWTSAVLIIGGAMWLLIGSGFLKWPPPLLLVVCVPLGIFFLSRAPQYFHFDPQTNAFRSSGSAWVFTLVSWHPIWTVGGDGGLQGTSKLLLLGSLGLAIVGTRATLRPDSAVRWERVLLPLALVLVVTALVIPLV